MKHRNDKRLTQTVLIAQPGMRDEANKVTDELWLKSLAHCSFRGSQRIDKTLA